jgi:GAF domain-containing protein
VATLVAQTVAASDAFTAVATEVAGLFDIPLIGLFRYEREGLATGRAGRMEDNSHRRGTFAAKAREDGLHSVVGAPIIVDGAVWGLVTIASTDGPISDQAEDRLAEFTELVGTAIANTQSRTELSASRARIVAAGTRPGAGGRRAGAGR